MGQDLHSKVEHDKVLLEKKLNKAVANGEAFFTVMKEKGEHIEEEVKKYADNVDTYIKKHPVKATIFAGIAGLFVGKFLMK
jgi:ElaB/YqjD/DUF883 family membrane-anchored ribosome-binding protein